MGASASSGFAVEAIGREATFLERFISLFGHIPIISNLAYMLVKSLGMEKDASDLVPKISMVLLAFLIGITPFIVKSLLHVWLVITRTYARGSGANARFATFLEVYQGYTVPSRFSTFVFPYVLALFFIVWIDISFQTKLDLVVIMFLAVLLGYGINRLRGTYKNIRKRVQPYPLGKYSGINIYLTGGRRMSFLRGNVKEQRQGHLMVIAPSGAGKTTNYIIPGVLEDAHNNCSAIVIEAKASAQEDMFKLIAPTWAAAGKKVILFDPWSGEGVNFNPLMQLTPSFSDPVTRDTIEDIVDAIYRTYETEKGSPSGDAAYYSDQEKSLVKGLLTLSLFKPIGERNLAAIAEVVNGTLESTIQYINGTLRADNRDYPNLEKDIRKNFQWFTDEANLRADLRASTLRGIAGKLAVFTHPRIMSAVVNDELDLDIIFKEPTLLCIKAPINIPGATTMASILIRLLMSRVPNKLSYGAGEDFKVFFYLDELPALAIPKFAEFCKTARSSGTGILASIQDRSDMADVIRAKLGINSIDGLLNNFKTQILMAGLQHGTVKHYSDGFGKVDVKSRRTARSTTNPIDSSYFTSREEKVLIQPDTIRYMKKDKSLIVDMNARPFFATTVPWYQSNKYTGMVNKHKNIVVNLYRKQGEAVIYQAPEAPRYNTTDINKVRGKKVEDVAAIVDTKMTPGVPTALFQPPLEQGSVQADGRSVVRSDMENDHIVSDTHHQGEQEMGTM